jgi:hypothetical protein
MMYRSMEIEITMRQWAIPCYNCVNVVLTVLLLHAIMFFSCV